MWTLDLRHSTKDDGTFQASGETPEGKQYTLSGKCSKTADGIVLLQCQLEWSSGLSEYLNGYIDQSESWVGYRGKVPDVNESSHTHRIIFRQIPPHLMALRPTPLEFDDNRCRALWKFALTSAVQFVRKKSWSWSYFKERRDIRNRFLELSLRYSERGRSGDPVYEELLDRRRAICPADARLYVDMLDLKRKFLSLHQYVTLHELRRLPTSPSVLFLGGNYVPSAIGSSSELASPA